MDIFLNTNIAELIGYAASLLIAISMLMTCILRLRWFIMAGNLMFIVYGILIHAYPIVILNSFNALVNIWFIYQAYNLKGNYAVLHAKNNAPMLERFLSYYSNDIHKFFPHFQAFHQNDIVFLIVKGTAVISVAGFRKNEDTSFEVILDYVAKTHRNHKPGKLIIEQENIFNRLGCNIIYAQSYHRKHSKYLRSMNFTLVETNRFVLENNTQNNF